MTARGRRLQRLEDVALERYIRSATDEELCSLIDAIDDNLRALGWTQEQIEAGTKRYIQKQETAIK